MVIGQGEEGQMSAVRIHGLPVADKWKERFIAIHAAGGPKLPAFKQLTLQQRMKAQSLNFWAFLFGPFYYLYLGMWKKGLSLFVVCASLAIAAGIALDAVGLSKVGDALGYGVAAVYGIRANIDYYQKLVLGENGWW